TAKTIGDTVRSSESSLIAGEYLARAQIAVCKRLPPADFAAHMNQMVDLVLEARHATKEKDKFRYTLLARTMSTLSGQLDAKAATRIADDLISILGDNYLLGSTRSEFIDSFTIPEDLARVADRLDAPGSLRAAEALIPVLTKGKYLANIEL